MILPFIPENLFELNNNLDSKFDEGVVIIDNIFKNYKKILAVCNNMSVEQWKTSPTSRNFKDYYDCRPIFYNFFPPSHKINKRFDSLSFIIAKHFNVSKHLQFQREFTFNYYKNIKKDIPSNLQHFPHRDRNFNIVFYIDPLENGGTALYENYGLEENKEQHNLLYDISELKIKKIIPSKPNRCVIFPGDQLHGGYIKDHNVYYYNWRINMVNFLTQK